MAEVTKCHSGFEKGSHQTQIPNHNIRLKKEKKMQENQSLYGTNLCGMHTETNDQRFKI